MTLIVSRSLRSTALLAPAVTFIVLLLIYPLVMLIGESFSGGSLTEPYVRLLASPIYAQLLLRTFLVSALTALICLLLGYPMAYKLVNGSDWVRAVIAMVILLPFWTNILVRSYGWMIILNPQGVLNRGLLWLGIVNEPVALVYNRIGLLIGMVQIMLPYMVLPIAAVMSRLDKRLTDAARSLGAGPGKSFLFVYFPLTLPGVMAGVLLVFAISLGFFIIPAILGGQRDMMLAQLIEFNINTILNWSFASAMSAVLLAVTLTIYGVALRWFGLGAIWGMR